MRTVLLVASEAREFNGLVARLGWVQRPRIPVDYAREAIHRGARWLLAANGIGQRLAVQAVERVIEYAPVDAFVSTGYCGALDPALAPLSVLAADEVSTMDGFRRYPAQRLPLPDLATGLMLTADHIVSSPAEKAALRVRTGAVAVDMESAAVAEAASRAGKPFYCVRIVSDAADEGFGIDLNRARDTEGRLKPWKVVREALKKPAQGVPELIHLQRRAERASQILGDCLADCDF